MKISELTTEQLKALVEEAVEEKLAEMLGDPDQGLELRDEVKERIARSIAETERGVRGIPVEHVAKRIGVE